MSLIRIISFILILFSYQSLVSQVGGENVFNFLNLSTSSRQIALGGEVLTLRDDVNQSIWNPSTININLHKQLAVNYTNFIAGISIGSVSYAYEIDRRVGVLQANIQYLNYGTLIESDENGLEIGTFNASDFALSVGYAYNFPKTNFYIGSNLRFITSSISNFTSTGFSLDFGVSYFSEFKPYSFTLVVRNLGTQIQPFEFEKEEIPLKISLGIDYKLEHVPLKWYLTLDNLQQWDISEPNPSKSETDFEGNITEEDISFFTNAIKHFVIGAELLPEKAINLRLGYNFRRASELQLQNARTFSGISFGFGIRMNKLKFNYAFSKYHSASNASTFSLQIDLDKRRDNE